MAHSTKIHGPRQVTDVYLLALAVRHAGRFVTFDAACFDAALSRDAVIGSDASHLLVL